MKLALAVLVLVLVAAAASAVPLNPYLDFQVLFHANMGLLRGIALYDHAAQVEMIAEIADVPAAQVYILPFPYPPWYALSTIWLAWLPVDKAVRVWFGLNLLMLVASSSLLTSGQPIMRRVLISLSAVFWLPALGSLFVGQYGFPVLLGAALMVLALKEEKPAMMALAAALLTFKPHLGLVIVLVVIALRLSRRDRFSREAALGLLAAAAVLFGLGFLASHNWPTAYAVSLMGFQGQHGVAECTQCVSLPIMMARLTGGGLSVAAWIALALAVPTCAWLAWRCKALAFTTSSIVSVGTLATLLMSPYLLNYDYLLLLVPLIALAGEALTHGEWAALGLAFVLPPAALALGGPGGNPVLVISTCIVLVLTIRRVGFFSGPTVTPTA
jgi:alpha-1,2-mannosyltransferase